MAACAAETFDVAGARASPADLRTRTRYASSCSHFLSLRVRVSSRALILEGAPLDTPSNERRMAGLDARADEADEAAVLPCVLKEAKLVSA
jgi:hypothetical protein